MVYCDPADQDEGDVHTGTRVCRACSVRKAMTEFHWTASRKHRARKCKTCAHAKQAGRIAVRKERGEVNLRADRLRREYGLTPDAVAEMRAAQGDACAICSKPLGDDPNIDHCHETGHVRALLCRPCNLGLGHFRDDPEILLRAAEYVRFHAERLVDLPEPESRELTPAERQERRREAALRQHRSEEGQRALAERGATYRGEQGNAARLAEAEVLAIRSAYAAGEVSQRQLAEKYGVTQSHIGYIVRRKVWTHV